MNRRNFLKFAPILPVLGIGTAMANVNPPTEIPLPFKFVGKNGAAIIIDQDGDAITFNREDMPKDQHVLLLHKPTPTVLPGLVGPNPDNRDAGRYANLAWTPGFYK